MTDSDPVCVRRWWRRCGHPRSVHFMLVTGSCGLCGCRKFVPPLKQRVEARDFGPCDHCGTPAQLCSTFDVINDDLLFEATAGCCSECGHPGKEKDAS